MAKKWSVEVETRLVEVETKSDNVGKVKSVVENDQVEAENIPLSPPPHDSKFI